MAKTTQKETPLMAQYNSIKAKYPDAVLLFRVGDFYETFGQDAVRTSQILGIVLTKRNNGEGVLLISSELSEILKLSDRIYVIFEGKIVGEFTRSNVSEQKLGVLMMGGKLNEKS